MRGRNAAAALAVVALVGLRASAACNDGSGGGSSSGEGGAGGVGGGASCPEGVAPLFTLRVRGPEAVLPADLVLDVSWSAGDEPQVVLGDPGSLGTSTSNVICALVPPTIDGEGGGPPEPTGEGGGAPSVGDEGELLCELWTSGPTRVRLVAVGFAPLDETLVPVTVDGCERPVPSEVPLELVLEEDEAEDDDA